jgi:hypothetical protein
MGRRPPRPGDRRGAFAPIRAALGDVPVAAVARTSGLSSSYASSVRSGEYVPHPRHWPALARLGGVLCPFEDAEPSEALDLRWWQERVAPALATISTVEIRRMTGLSKGSCSKVRRGLQTPNPKHWLALAALAGRFTSCDQGLRMVRSCLVRAKCCTLGRDLS